MTNVASRTIRWGIWSNTQLNAADATGSGYNRKLCSFTPLNPASRFYRGYHVLFGLVNNPSFAPDYEQGMMRVEYKRLIGKVGLDCAAGWTALVDGTNGYAFVQRFTYEPEMEYPNGASVEIWLDGVGDVWVGENIWKGVEDPGVTPLCFESELVSPYVALAPDESYHFDYDWFAARIGGQYPVLDCTEVGVMCEPLHAEVSADRVVLRGRFGVFYEGTVAIAFADETGREVTREKVCDNASPLEPLVCDSVEVPSPPDVAATAALVVFDDAGEALGVLGRTSIER